MIIITTNTHSGHNNNKNMHMNLNKCNKENLESYTNIAEYSLSLSGSHDRNGSLFLSDHLSVSASTDTLRQQPSFG